MWLLPVLSALCWLVSRVVYRLSVDGPTIPPGGPVLLVANHPNSLIDPVIVAGITGRRVRFLAKAPLFTDSKIGWMVKAAGAIPVYRKQDDPSAMGQNRDVFEAVIGELAAGAAIGMFPEGISHSEPSLAVLRTGTARMALGAYQEAGCTFPIIPVGIVPARKESFRSEMRVVLGEPISWDDLAAKGRKDRDAVRELTARIDQALRGVTLNLEEWEDRPLVETAEAIWSLQVSDAEGAVRQLRRFEVIARILGTVRQGSDQRWSAVQRDLLIHYRRLALFGFRPADLLAEVSLPSSVRWSARRLYLVGIPFVVLALAGHVTFWVPFRLTRLLTDRARPALDRVSTYKLLYGILTYSAWVFALALIGVWAWGWGLGDPFVRAPSHPGNHGHLDQRALALGLPRHPPLHDPAYAQRRDGGVAHRAAALGLGARGALRGLGLRAGVLTLGGTPHSFTEGRWRSPGRCRQHPTP